MKALGALLVLGGAAALCLLLRRERMVPLRVGRALAADLEVLRCGICLRRAPLPQILEETLQTGLGADWLWRPLLALLREAGEDGLPRCWERAAADLPEPLAGLLAPMGPLLPIGGERLGAAIEEVRAALDAFLKQESASQADKSRVTAALCLAGACLVILVLI